MRRKRHTNGSASAGDLAVEEVDRALDGGGDEPFELGCCEEARRRIELITADVEVGRVYEGRVARLMDFGAFVTILPGKDGLVHISQISDERVEHVSDKLAEPMEPEEMEKLLEEQGRLQDQIDAAGAWELEHKLEIAMEALRCPAPDSEVGILSGGERGDSEGSDVGSTFKDFTSRMMSPSNDDGSEEPNRDGKASGLARWFGKRGQEESPSIKDVYYQYVDDSGTVHFVQNQVVEVGNPVGSELIEQMSHPPADDLGQGHVLEMNLIPAQVESPLSSKITRPFQVTPLPLRWARADFTIMYTAIRLATGASKVYLGYQRFRPRRMDWNRLTST